MSSDLFAAIATPTGVETRRCKACEKTPGEHVMSAFTSSEGRHYPETRRICSTCDGTPDMPRPDFAAMLIACKGQRGLRSARPQGREAYYIWRMARFHGGEDPRMPMEAMGGVRGNPWEPELEKLADLVAQEVFGTRLGAARRWGAALGVLPDSASSMVSSPHPGGREPREPLERLAKLV